MSEKPFGRLAFRAEGIWWNCYIARMDTMKDAIPIGSILLRVTEERRDIRNHFMQTMQAAFEYTLQQTTGGKVAGWGEPTSAPDKDRTKPT